MATIDIGKIKIVWKGPWNSGTAYTIDDAVSHGGNSYICIQAGTNQNPSTATAYWQAMAQGADLINIAGTAQGDIYYNNGSAIAKLAAGTSGQFLQTGGASANPSWGTVSQLIKGIAAQANSINSEVIITSNSGLQYTDICGGDLVYTPASNSSKIMIHLAAGMQDVSKNNGTGYGLALNIVQSSGINYTNHRKTHYGFYALSGLNVNYGQSISDMWVLNNSSTNQMTITGKGYTYSEGNASTARFREGTISVIEF